MYFEVFQGVHNHWYWRLLADQNRKVAFCSEGYDNKQDAIKGIALVKALSQVATIKEIAL
ncbi:YegP family protein [Bartonella sp. LJL80]